MGSALAAYQYEYTLRYFICMEFASMLMIIGV
jgi:hypothetical protein